MPNTKEGIIGERLKMEHKIQELIEQFEGSTDLRVEKIHLEHSEIDNRLRVTDVTAEVWI
jgi:hypothetical protein